MTLHYDICRCMGHDPKHYDQLCERRESCARHKDDAHVPVPIMISACSWVDDKTFEDAFIALSNV